MSSSQGTPTRQKSMVMQMTARSLLYLAVLEIFFKELSGLLAPAHVALCGESTAEKTKSCTFHCQKSLCLQINIIIFTPLLGIVFAHSYLKKPRGALLSSS